MKKADATTGTRNLEVLISKLSENNILNLGAMSNVRGGTGEGTGGEPIIIIPTPQP
jgi:hypothetical protein